MSERTDKAAALAGQSVPLAERDEASLTPLQKQYYEIKSQHSQYLLFFRLGDFYELFDEDAVLASRELDLALTTRDRGKPADEQMPMCGVPYHAADTYISRLLQKGYKIAICEQLEDPATAKGLVKRDVVRIITPGTVADGYMLDSSRSNYVCALYAGRETGAVAFCDVTTGEFFTAECAAPVIPHLLNELSSFAPSEAVLSAGAAENRQLTDFLARRLNCSLEKRDETFDLETCEKLVCRQFRLAGLESAGLDRLTAAVRAAGALLAYIAETQKCDLSHINTVELLDGRRYMELDWSTRRSLELTANLRTGEKRGSLLWVLDRTRTPMGARLLRSWVEMPLLHPTAIQRRLSAVSELVDDNLRRQELMAALGGIGDLQRLVSRTVYKTANGRDLLALANSCESLPRIKELLSGSHSAILAELAALDTLDDIRDEVLRTIQPDAPFSISEGGMICPGYSEELDRLRDVRDNAASLIKQMERSEQERTGIKKLKIGYNRVFGYYIDVPASAQGAALPDEYIRKQTLANHERYFTAELKALEAEISNARESVNSIENSIFCALRGGIAAKVDRVQATAEAIARLDAVCSLAETAVRNGYVRPEVDDSGVIEIHAGRHPVVEQMRKDTLFVPNDTYLNLSSDRLAIITGPNMAGKSTYMRQTALIALMAQIGSFVPARAASIGVVDRVFTRIGASDDLSSGQSTFMVEMTEVADILKNATRRSLILLDEIGRGTSTYDGMAIARAVLEYCADTRRLGAKTLLSTHYHELTALEGQIDGVKNYSITARKQGGGVIFLRKIVPGAADESYGVEVAKLAGVPDSVVNRARVCLDELNRAAARPAAEKAAEPDDGQLSFGQSAADEVLDALRSARLDTLSPIEAMNLLYELQRKLAP